MFFILDDFNSALIVKTIENEIRNYKFWIARSDHLDIEKARLDKEMYDVRAINYGTPTSRSKNNREHKLISQITYKEEIQEEIDLIQAKKNLVEDLLKTMEEEDRKFIEKVLINRKYQDTNGSIAIRLNLTESGLRYKIDVILRQAIIKFIEEKEE